jgi:hypothetical protein
VRSTDDVVSTLGEVDVIHRPRRAVDRTNAQLVAKEARIKNNCIVLLQSRLNALKLFKAQHKALGQLSELQHSAALAGADFRVSLAKLGRACQGSKSCR